MPEKTTLEYLHIISRDAHSVQAAYQLDRKGNWFPIGLLKERVTVSPHIGKKCRSVRFKFTENSQVASIIEGFNIEHTPEKQKK